MLRNRHSCGPVLARNASFGSRISYLVGLVGCACVSLSLSLSLAHAHALSLALSLSLSKVMCIYIYFFSISAQFSPFSVILSRVPRQTGQLQHHVLWLISETAWETRFALFTEQTISSSSLLILASSHVIPLCLRITFLFQRDTILFPTRLKQSEAMIAYILFIFFLF